MFLESVSTKLLDMFEKRGHSSKNMLKVSSGNTRINTSTVNTKKPLSAV